MTKKTVFGLNENIGGVLCYLFIWVSGIIMLVLERDNKFVRFHALQSFLWFGSLSIIGIIIGWIARIPLIGPLVSFVYGAFVFICWLFLMYNAFKGQTFKTPIVGEIVHKQVNK